jgi:hypothetical protein
MGMSQSRPERPHDPGAGKRNKEKEIFWGKIIAIVYLILVVGTIMALKLLFR